MTKTKAITIDWEQVPDIVTKEQFCKLCHIAKNIARNLLLTGEVPCHYSGKKSKCYYIRKEDVRAYLESRDDLPRRRFSGSGEERTVTYEAYTEKHLPPNIRQAMQRFYEDMMSDYPDVLTISDIVAITGYCTKTVNRWCASGDLQSFKRGHCNHIPKVIFIEFLCSHHFRAFANKNAWHKSAMHEFTLLVDKLDEIPAEGGDER